MIQESLFPEPDPKPPVDVDAKIARIVQLAPGYDKGIRISDASLEHRPEVIEPTQPVVEKLDGPAAARKALEQSRPASS